MTLQITRETGVLSPDLTCVTPPQQGFTLGHLFQLIGAAAGRGVINASLMSVSARAEDHKEYFGENKTILSSSTPRINFLLYWCLCDTKGYKAGGDER